MEKKEKNKGGAPSKFNDAVKEKMLELLEKGKTEQQVADIIGVHVTTIRNWKGKHPELVWAIKEAKQIADDLVEASLFSKACGYSHEEEKIFLHEGKVVRAKTRRQYAPDTTAGIFWLKNRKPELWREKENPDVVINNYSNMTDDELNERLAELEQRRKD